jgi:hypothetical protein
VDVTGQVNAAMAAAAELAGRELVAQATNLFGVLSPAVRARLLALILDPSPDTWDDAHSIVLNGGPGRVGTTLWQAVLPVDPDCPRRGAPEGTEPVTAEYRWSGYAPDVLTVLTAIQTALDHPGR